MSQPFEAACKAVRAGDATRVRELLRAHPDLKVAINEPVDGCDALLHSGVPSRDVLDALIEAGADLNTKTRWWAGGFGFLHTAEPDLAAHAIERGATVDVHAAARLGLIERLRELVSADPGLVNARGGDGQTPLHFASTVAAAEYLLDHGADIEARDVDHESTPAQYMVGDRTEVLRFLILRGAKTDLLLAAGLGDVDLARRHLDRDPESIRLRVSHEHFPMIGGRAGGTIYQWKLGWYVSPHQVARKFGHEPLFRLLLERSPDDVKLINACWLNDAALLASLGPDPSRIAAGMQQEDRRQLAHAARNNDFPAVRMMLTVGLPVDSRSQHGATPLHWAAWHGNLEMVRALLEHRPPMEQRDADFDGTPLRWAIHGSENGWDRSSSDYAGVVNALLDAGAKAPEKESGTEAVRDALRKHRAKS